MEEGGEGRGDERNIHKIRQSCPIEAKLLVMKFVHIEIERKVEVEGEREREIEKERKRERKADYFY